MTGVFSASQVKELDAKEIKLEGITSFELMERASSALKQEICKELQNIEVTTIIYLVTGGNNGGDTLCVANMLCGIFNSVVFYVKSSDKCSSDFATAYERIKGKTNIIELTDTESISILKDYLTIDNVLIVDGLLGSGINRVVGKETLLGRVIEYVNEERCATSRVVSIDLPSGLMGEDKQMFDKARSIIKADKTICMQYPKLSTLMPECEEYVGELSWVDFDMKLMKEQKGDIGDMLEKEDIRKLIMKRPRHGHKGTFGKGLLIAGSKEMPGACVLSAKSAMRSGLGMLYAYTHENVKPFLINNLPEAVCKTYSETEVEPLLSTTDFAAIGPGIGVSDESKRLLQKVLEFTSKPLVLDADALNIISQNKELLKRLPKGTILTPHPAEFQRLFGKCSCRIEMIDRQKQMARELGVIIVLKGAYTTITDGEQLLFNTTGNSGMATAGSGDVLTGMILSFLSQGYNPFIAAQIGVYLHGFAGDCSANKLGEHSVIASDIIGSIGLAIKQLCNKTW